MNLPSTIFLLNILIGIFEISIQISGGGRIPAGFSTYQVLIMRLGHIICNGGIIRPTHILTTASCVIGFQESAFAVLGGRMDLVDSIPQWRNVKRIHLFPNYTTHVDRWNFTIGGPQRIELPLPLHDIAVLKLAHPFQYTGTIRPLELAKHNCENVDICKKCVITGWGRGEELTPIGQHLMFIKVRVLSLKESICQGMIPRRNQFGVEDVRQRMASYPGDCGTPVVCSGFTVGILISENSSPYHSGVFLAVAPYFEFIKEAVNNG